MKKLRRLYPQRYVLDNREAHRVLTFFFGKGNVNLPATGATGLRLDDIEFAQALLIEGVEKTATLNSFLDVAELFLKDGVGKIKPLIRKLAKEALEKGCDGWFIQADEDDLKNPKIARTIRKTMRGNFKSAWQGRVEDGDTIWNHVHG